VVFRRVIRRVILSPLKKGALSIIGGEMIFAIGANFAILSGSRRIGRARMRYQPSALGVCGNHVFIAL